MNLVKLIESVKKQSNIYKKLHEDDEEYYSEWKYVADECQISLDEAQDQWNMLLLEYMEYLRGNNDFSMSKYMDFIQPHLFTIIDDDVIDENELLNILNDQDNGKTVIQTDAILSVRKEEETNSNEINIQLNPETDEIEYIKKPTKVTINNLPNKIEFSILSAPSLKTELSQTSKPSTSTQESQKFSQNPPVAIETAKNSQIPPASNTEDSQSFKESFSNLSSMDLIFLGYAKQLQKMPLPLQQQTKRKIAEIMDEAELKMMDQM